jgi:hypothetical protein
MGTFSTVGNFRDKSGGVSLNSKLLDVLQAAAALSPYNVEAFSAVAGRSAGTQNHPGGHAIDLRLIDPATGKELDNYQKGGAFKEYERFAQMARVIQQDKYPELNNLFRWGGYFAGGSNPADLMHFDVNPKLRGAMGGGSWERGANSAYLKKWGYEGNPGLGDTRYFSQIQEQYRMGKPYLPPAPLGNDAPLPASRSGVDTLRTRYASLNAPIPMPRPAARMPATPGAGTRMTDAQVAELYRGILPIARSGPVGSGAPTSLTPFTRPALRPQQPVGSGQPISFSPFLPTPARRPSIVDSVRSPRLENLDGQQFVRDPPGTVGLYGADYAAGFGSLMDHRTPSPGTRNPAPTPSFAQQFASRLASVPSTTSRTVAPGAGLSQEQAQAMRAVPVAPRAPASPVGAGAPISPTPFSRPTPAPSGPSFASQFASRIAAVPPVPAPLPASRMPPVPATVDQRLLARTGVGGSANVGPVPIPATMSAALAASRMAQPSAAPMGLSWMDKASNAIAVGAMQNGGGVDRSANNNRPLTFAPPPATMSPILAMTRVQQLRALGASPTTAYNLANDFAAIEARERARRLGSSSSSRSTVTEGNFGGTYFGSPSTISN